jgi:hypothetical protein
MDDGASPEVVATEAATALADLAGRDLTRLTDAEVEQHAIATAELLRLAEATHVAAMARLTFGAAGSCPSPRAARWDRPPPGSSPPPATRCR